MTENIDSNFALDIIDKYVYEIIDSLFDSGDYNKKKDAIFNLDSYRRHVINIVTNTEVWGSPDYYKLPIYETYSKVICFDLIVNFVSTNSKMTIKNIDDNEAPPFPFPKHIITIESSLITYIITLDEGKKIYETAKRINLEDKINIAKYVNSIISTISKILIKEMLWPYGHKISNYRENNTIRRLEVGDVHVSYTVKSKDPSQDSIEEIKLIISITEQGVNLTVTMKNEEYLKRTVELYLESNNQNLKNNINDAITLLRNFKR
ncbi:MAG: hypothetical protein QXI58_00425 [Candidatus Micrarchaeia archaeon]